MLNSFNRIYNKNSQFYLPTTLLWLTLYESNKRFLKFSEVRNNIPKIYFPLGFIQYPDVTKNMF